MEIQALKLLITEQDLNEAVVKRLPEDPEIRKLRVQLTPEGVYVTGVYRMLINVPFETVWELAAAGGKLTARLSAFKALGIPVSMFKTMIMDVLGDTVRTVDALETDGDTVRLDLERLLAKEGVALRTNLTAVRCQAGHLILEAASGDHPNGKVAAV